jgi:hypothetical protein
MLLAQNYSPSRFSLLFDSADFSADSPCFNWRGLLLRDKIFAIHRLFIYNELSFLIFVLADRREVSERSERFENLTERKYVCSFFDTATTVLRLSMERS